MKVNELKNLCKSLGLKVSGTKKDLEKRLWDYENEDNPSIETNEGVDYIIDSDSEDEKKSNERINEFNSVRFEQDQEYLESLRKDQLKEMNKIKEHQELKTFNNDEFGIEEVKEEQKEEEERELTLEELREARCKRFT